MSDPVRFRELRVVHMPGFEDAGFRLTGLTGITLVHGPNASGKTSAARALQRLLWPGDGEDGMVVRGRFTLEDAAWQVEVNGSRVQWERDGEPASPPALPDATTRDRYNLSLTELLRTDDRDLADRIRVETAGGYDVPAIGEKLGFQSRGRPRSLMDQLSEARAELQEAREGAEALRQDRARLAELEVRRQELANDAARAQVLERAHTTAEKRAAVEGAREEAARYPEAAGELRGDEVERWDEWAEREAGLRETAAAADRTESKAEVELEDADLGEDGVSSAELTELEERLEAVRSAEAEIAAEEGKRDEARARRQHTGNTLGIDEETVPDDLVPPDLARLDAFLERAQEVGGERAAYEGWLRQLETGDSADDGQPGDEAADTESLQASIRDLRSWLRAGPDSGPRGPSRLIGWSVAGFFLLTVLLGGLTVAGLVSPAWVGWVVAGVAAVAGVLLLARRPAADVDRRRTLEAEVERRGHAPDRWKEDAVRDRLDELEGQVARATLTEERRAEKARWEMKRAGIEAAEAELEKERDGLEASLGLEIGGGDVTRTLVARRLSAWLEARDAERAAEARVENATEAHREALEIARRQLEPFGFDPPEDAAALKGFLVELRERRDRHRDARADLRQARRDREEARAALEELEGKRNELLERVGVETAAALRDLAEKRAARVEAENELELAERQLKAAREGLQEAAERLVEKDEGDADRVMAELENATAAELDHELEVARTAVADEREVAEEMAEIQGALKEARTRTAVEEALAAVKEAETALEDRRDRDIDAEVGVELLGWLEASESDTNRPQVFHRAREIFTRITRGHYRLEMSRDGSAFRAYDTVAEKGRSLDQLSSGTRIQLLLAVRVAFVETQEHGSAPPLLLDEVLANADDVRARAIIEAAVELALDGRQIFYFTAQGDELAKWREHLKGVDVEWAEVAIPAPDSEALPDDWAGRAVEHPTPPDPQGHDYASYGEVLDIPPFDPWVEGVGRLHLWYVLEDVELLHQLLALGIDRWGKLRNFARSGGADHPAVREAMEAAGDAAALCRRFGELWRRGRGRAVDRAALEASGAVTDTFMDRVDDLCQRLGGNAEALIAALEEGEASRFRSGAIEELREYFLRNGYMTREEPLDGDTIRLELVAMADDELEEAAARVGRLLARLGVGAPGEASAHEATAAEEIG